MPLLDDATERYESEVARLGYESVDVRSFLPAESHPEYAAVAVELLRIRLEHQSEAGRLPAWSELMQEFPHLAEADEAASELRFEYDRLQRSADESAHGDAEDRILTDHDWTESVLKQVNRDSTSQSLPSDAKAGGTAKQLGALLPGKKFGDFFIIGEIGRGAFASVYLAEQLDLSARPVVLKVSRQATAEPQKLALLQHPNIVQILSLHRVGGYHLICMPYIGAATLADLITVPDTTDTEKNPARSGTTRRGSAALKETLSDRRQSIQTIVEGAPSGSARSWMRTDSTAARRQLSDKQPWERTVCELVRQIAAGLAHAHSHGIVHCDLKPANVLVGDDGEARLVDFNVAIDSSTSGKRSSAVGGTLPYMAPEHLSALLGAKEKPGPQSDLYSLGVVFYQLLSGRLPFAHCSGDLDTQLAKMLNQRSDSANMRPLSAREVSSSVIAMVEELLQPTLERRYRSAEQLVEDLDRHLSNKPLRYARERALGARFSKWCKRHPRLSSVATVGTVAACLTAAAVGTAWSYRTEVRRGEARQLAAEFEQQSLETMVLAAQARRLSDPDLELTAAAMLQQVTAPLMDSASRGSSGSLRTKSVLSYLDENELKHIAISLQELTDIADAGQVVAVSNRLNADDSLPTDSVRTALDAMRAEYSIVREIDLSEFGSGGIVEAINAYLRHDWTRALEKLQRLADTNERQPLVWYMIGLCYSEQGDRLSADQAFATCIGLDVDYWPARHARGLTMLQSAQSSHSPSQFKQAERTFRDCLAIQPGLVESHYNLALCLEGQGDRSGAEQSVSHFIELCGESNRHDRVKGYVLRARLNKAAGNLAEADKDLNAARRGTPLELSTFSERGFALIKVDPKQALTDLLRAEELNSHDERVFQNLAHLTMEVIPDEVIAERALNSWLALNPNSGMARGSRGVFLARRKRFDEARRDADFLAKEATGGYELAMAASIYSIQAAELDAASKEAIERRGQALKLLARALQSDWKLAAVLEQDNDMSALRGEASFRKLIETAAGIARLPQMANVSSLHSNQNGSDSDQADSSSPSAEQ
ncbi:MAG: protein kinase [Pirellulales bacterium]